MEFKNYQNVHQMLKETVDRRPGDTAYRWFLGDEDGQAMSVTWKEFYAQVQKAAKSLMALGVKKNDKVNILSYTCYRWVLTDLAAMGIGAASVGIYQSNLPKDCRYIINHSDAVVLFAENEIQLAKIRSIRDEIPNIRKVVLFQGDPGEDDWVISYSRFLELGEDIADADLEKRFQAAGPDDPAGIVYTSGTTGVPKGAVLTHDNITFTAQSVNACTRILDSDETFIFLPLAHVFARICIHLALLRGLPTTFARSIDTLTDDLKRARPHYFASVPRIYEKVHSKVLGGAEAKGGAALAIFRWACDIGEKVSDRKQAKKPVPFLLGLQYRMATRLVFQKLQDALGGRVRFCISGAAPLNPAIAKFFHAAGVLILEGIGMTENTSFTNLNRFDDYRFGWVGRPGPGVEQRIAADGEVLFRGRNVMKEYYKMPEETARTLTPDGWQHSGDVGEIDDQGFLRITGRKKELIITAGGKNIAPAAIEGLIATSKYINQVCVIGDQRKYLGALVSLDAENISEYARERGIAFKTLEELIVHPAVVALVEREIAAKNRELASFETVKRFRIVPEFTIENEMLTPTLKLKKNLITARYKDEIEGLFAV